MAINTKTHEVNTFTGLSPFSVTIDHSARLNELIVDAENCQGLPFEEKLKAVQEIAKKSMINAYECMKDPLSDPSMDMNAQFQLILKCSNIVEKTNPLSTALDAHAGCCRYQSTLFLILGAAAKLGDAHYLQSTPINSRLDTCYNDVVYNGKVHHVSIFTQTIKNKTYDYTVQKGPTLFENPIRSVPGQLFLAYTTDSSGNVHKYARTGAHFDA